MKRVAAALVSMVAGVSMAQAGTVTTYTDLASFNAALGATPMTVETFTNDDHFPITTGKLDATTNLAVSVGPAITPGMIQPGVTYSTPIGQGYFFNIDCCMPGSNQFLDSVTGSNPLTATFWKTTNAFGFDAGMNWMHAMTVTINFASGPSFTQSFASDNIGFYGFQSDSRDITSVVIGGGTGFSFAVDNFRFANPVPEPETYGMMMAGLALIGAVARRRKTPQA